MYLKTISTLSFLFSLTLLLTTISCTEEETPKPEDPRDQFIGTHSNNLNQWCNEVDTYTSEILMGNSSSAVVWTNILGEEGSDDDVNATIFGNKIKISSQLIGSKLYEGEGELIDGKILMFTKLKSGIAEVFCEYEINLD